MTGKELYDHSGMFDKSPYQTEHDQLFASIRAGEVINNAEYGAKSTMTALLGRMATYSGKRIEWDEALSSKLELVPASASLSWDGDAPVQTRRERFLRNSHPPVKREHFNCPSTATVATTPLS